MRKSFSKKIINSVVVGALVVLRVGSLEDCYGKIKQRLHFLRKSELRFQLMTIRNHLPTGFSIHTKFLCNFKIVHIDQN